MARTSTEIGAATQWIQYGEFSNTDEFNEFHELNEHLDNDERDKYNEDLANDE